MTGETAGETTDTCMNIHSQGIYYRYMYMYNVNGLTFFCF